MNQTIVTHAAESVNRVRESRSLHCAAAAAAPVGMTKKNERVAGRAAGAGIVCGNSKAMAVRRPGPYNGGRLAARRHLESPAKVRANSAVKRAKDGEQPARPCKRLNRGSKAATRGTKVATSGARAEPVVAGILGGLSMADAREVMNIRQASQYLGVSPDTLYKYVSEEKIPAFKLGNRWKFKKSILDTWMESKSLNSEVSRPRKLLKTQRTAVS
jgi:excisionase family DNA binding protein